MKKLFPAVIIALVLFSCNDKAGKGLFTLTGEIKSSPDQKIYLEELYFSAKQPEVLDTAEIKNGKFTVSAIAPEEGLYRLRTEDGASSWIFVNDGSKMSFTGIANNPDQNSHSFSGSANGSLKKLVVYLDSVSALINNKNRLLTEFAKAGVNQADSTYQVISNDFTALNDNFAKFSFAFADTTKNPVVALFAATMAPVELSKFEAPIAQLMKRFPNHKGISEALNFVKTQATAQTQAPQPAKTASVGDMAPELTMNDVDDKPFSLSQLRGKYVLVDFWASWCAPCRDENPNVVAVYNQFKDKNFTVLGVSLDKNKAAWMNAIKEDKLNWQHISDLKYWSSTAVGLFGFDGIPYNVLVDPQGKIIATALRGNELRNKLVEVLK